MDDVTVAQRLARIEAHLCVIRMVCERLVPVLDLVEPLLPMARTKLGRSVLAAGLGRGGKS